MEYRAGGIDTLVRVVDANGGCPVREISLMIREDFVRDRLLNIIRDCIRSIIPEKMLDSGHFS